MNANILLTALRAAVLVWFVCFADARDRLVTRRAGLPTCTDPGIPENGYRNGAVFYPGYTVSFGCDPGYNLVGSKAIICTYGTNEVFWDVDTPKCTRVTPFARSQQSDPCGAPPAPTTSAVQHAYSPGVSVEYRCMQGYTRSSGDDQLLCRDGEWKGNQLQCRKLGECTDYGDLENGYRTLEGTTEGDIVTFGCDEGYELLGNPVLTCGSDGFWVGAWPTCVGATVDCGDPGTPTMGSRLVMGTMGGAVVNYDCEPGCVLRGASQRVCLDTGRWSRSLPVCEEVDCGQPQEPSHGSVQYESSSFGAMATYTCDKGYVLSGAESVLCEDNRRWSAQPPTCNYVSCARLSSPRNGRVRFRQTTYGYSANYSCNSGYGLVGVHTRLCQENGQWSDSPPSCRSGSCGTLENPQNGRVSFSSMIINSVARYSCDLGYLLSGTWQRTCSPTGWTGTVPSCNPVKCPMPTIPWNGLVDLSDENLVYSVATYSCVEGFRMIGVKTRRCQPSGIWTETPPGCYRIDCGDLSGIHHGEVVYDAKTVGSEATYTCFPGYFPQFGDTIRTCMPNGIWSGNPPCCVRENITCNQLDDPENGRVIIDSFQVGSAARYECDDGFTLSGNSMSTCRADGFWSGTDPICIVFECPTLEDPENGQVNVTGVQPGDTASYTCNTNYVLNGNETRICQYNRGWSGDEPTCEILVCDVLVPPEDGSLMLTNGVQLHSVAFYECDADFVMFSGDGIRTCVIGGWTGTQPLCEPLVDCGPLNAPTDGSIIIPHTTTGSVVMYNCNEGFNITGPAKRICQPNGQWTGDDPECEPTGCPQLTPPDDGMVDVPSRSIMSVATYSCIDRYTLIGDGNRECLENRTWSGEAPECQLIECPTLSDPLNGEVTIPDNIPGSVAVFMCSENYGLRGPPTRTCQLDGTWSRSDPTCEFVTCPDLDDPVNGEVLPRCFEEDCRAAYDCNDGFELVPNILVRICLESGQWSGEEPACQRTNCVDLLDPENGAVTVMGNTPGSTADYTCDSGYILEGVSRRTCQEIGEWSGTAPTCRRRMCPELDPPLNGIVRIQNRLPGGTAMYECNSGFLRNGVLTRQCGTNERWAGVAPTCDPLPGTVTCPTLTAPENGEIELTTTTVGSFVTFTCLEGFRLEGSAERTCRANSQWTGGDTTCEAIDCGTLQSPANGQVTLSGTDFDSTATYRCQDGFDLVGQRIRFCRESGWSDTAPTCEPRDCGSLPGIVDGMVDTSSGTTFGSTATYTCNFGFILVGASERMCLANREWSGDAPTCIGDGCSDPGTPSNGLRTLTATTVGSVVEYTCVSGFTLEGDATRTCQSNNEWTGSLPDCVPVMCPVLAHPDNGEVHVTSGQEVGSIATYICDDGFEINSNIIQRVCLRSGQWSSEDLMCINTTSAVGMGPMATCPLLENPVNGNVSVTALTVQSTATYSCNLGYVLRGEGNRVCEESGAWSNEEPTCEIIQCEDPGTPENGRRFESDFNMGSRVYFVCNDGSVTQGANVLLCREDGTWDNGTPNCTIADSTCSGTGQVMDQFGRVCSCVSGQLQSCCRQRNDWSTLSDEDKQRYISAVITMGTDPQYQPLYNQFIETYNRSFDTIAQSTLAQTSQFFPWNRYFLMEYESILRLIDTRITIPFWDWSLLPDTPYISPVFDPTTGFGNSSSNQTLCVTSGPFREGVFEVTPSAGGGCLTRAYSDYIYPRRELIESEILTLTSGMFNEFHRSLHLFIHLNVRCFIGGDMCSRDAANDPLYILHLTRVDLVLNRWQSIDEARASARYATEDNTLVMSFDDSLLVSDFSSNSNLPYDISVCYGDLQEVPDSGVSPEGPPLSPLVP